jgi:hypothetical protein
MTVIKSLWASVQGDPVFMRRVNGWMTVFWILMIPISIVFGLLSSVAYVSALSLWALVSGHWSAWQRRTGRSRTAGRGERARRESDRGTTWSGDHHRGARTWHPPNSALDGGGAGLNLSSLRRGD